VNAVGPDVDVVAVREIALLEGLVVRLLYVGKMIWTTEPFC
jgi:hypothetical protein